MPERNPCLSTLAKIAPDFPRFYRVQKYSFFANLPNIPVFFFTFEEYLHTRFARISAKASKWAFCENLIFRKWFVFWCTNKSKITIGYITLYHSYFHWFLLKLLYRHPINTPCRAFRLDGVPRIIKRSFLAEGVELGWHKMIFSRRD